MNKIEFIEILLPMQDKLFRFARRILQNYEEAEDVVQDVLLKLWASRDVLGEKKNLEAFAMTVTKNLCIDRFRSKNFQTATSGLDASELELSANLISPLKSTEEADAVNIVKQIVETLPDNMKMIVQFRDIEGLEYDEISEITGVNINTLKVNLSRARKRIREILTTQYNYSRYEK
jgi:RNA polymerase sigma-70 factor (ECF subfamily)